MQRFLEINGQSIEYTLKASDRSRRMRLAVYRGGRFVVSVPTRMNERLIEKFLLEKADWIVSKIESMKKFEPVDLKPISKLELSRLKVVALERIHRRLEYFNQYYQFTYNKVTIRRQKTRWGSCSRAGNINFNYKLAVLPPHLADYIIVHELCHLREMNHSKQFWDLVAKTVPTHKTLRRELRKENLTL